jgi:hypothetical protein
MPVEEDLSMSACLEHSGSKLGPQWPGYRCQELKKATKNFRASVLKASGKIEMGTNRKADAAKQIPILQGAV